MAGSSADQYRRSLQNLLSRGSMQKPKQLMSMGGMRQGSWVGPSSALSSQSSQSLSNTLMNYMKQETSQHGGSMRRSSGFDNSQDRQDPSQPTWRYCELCDLHFQTHRDFQSHTSGTMHAKRVLENSNRGHQNQSNRGQHQNQSNRGQQRQSGGKSPGGYGSSQQQHNEKSVQKRSGSGFPFPYICKLCNIHTQREQDHVAHMEGKRHAEKYLSKITELGFRDFYDQYGDIPFNYGIDKRFIQPNGEYFVPKNSWKMLDVPLQYRKQVTEYIVRSASLHDISCKVCDNIVLNPSNWWSHVCGRKHTAKCAEIGAKLGWDSYLQIYGAIPLLDHDAVDAIKKGKPYLTQPETVPGRGSDIRQNYMSGGENLRNRSSQDDSRYHESSRQSGDGKGFQSLDYFQGSSDYGSNNRSKSPGFEDNQYHQLELERQRRNMLDREREEEMRRIKMMEEMRLREIEEESQRQRENRMLEEQRLQQEALRIQDEKRRVEEEKRQIEEERRRIQDEQRRRDDELRRQEEENRRREEELKRRHEEQVRDIAKRAEEQARRSQEEELERERRRNLRLSDPSNVKVEEAVSMVSVLLKGLQQQQPEVLQAAGIRLQDKSPQDFNSKPQEFGRDRREAEKSFERRRDRSRSPVHSRFRDDRLRRSPIRMEERRRSRERRERDMMWVGGNDEEEFVTEDYPEHYNDRGRTHDRGGRDRGRHRSPLRRSPPPPRPDRRDRQGRLPMPDQGSILGEPPRHLMSLGASPPLSREGRPPPLMGGSRNAPRETPQQSILGEPPAELRNLAMMGSSLQIQRPQGPSEEDYVLASQVQQMTGLQNIDDIAQAMSVLKSMDPEVVQLLGSLDPSVIESLVSGGPVAADLQGPVMDQLTNLINSGMIDTTALQLLVGTPGILGPVGRGGDRDSRSLPPRPPPRSLPRRSSGNVPRKTGGAPSGRRGPGKNQSARGNPGRANRRGK